MNDSKKGGYFKYLEPGSASKIPRSTLCNRRSYATVDHGMPKKRRENEDWLRFNDSQAQQIDGALNRSDIEESNHLYINDEKEIGIDDNRIELHENNAATENNIDVNCVGLEYNSTNTSLQGLEDVDMGDEKNENQDHECEPDFFIDTSADPYNKDLHLSIDINIKDIMLMVYAFAVSHKLDYRTMESSAQLINAVLGGKVIPDTKYHYKKLFLPSDKIQPTIHFQCNNCKLYLGTEIDLAVIDNSSKCPNCENNFKGNTKYNDRNYFVSISIEAQLKLHIEKAIRNNEINFHTNIEHPDVNSNINDVFDGNIYKNILSKYGNKKFITLTVNTDGAGVFKSASQSSLWPLQFFVNEICQKKRFLRSNLLSSGFAYGPTPNMCSFMRPFVNEINTINDSGGMDICINGNVEKLLVIPLIFTLDSVAKCDVLGKMQYNGYNGCPYCHHAGTHLYGSIIRFCERGCEPNRSDQDTRNAMRESLINGKPVRGYKYMSPLYGIKTLTDIVWAIAIDKMHNIDIGVVKKLFSLFLDKAHRKEE